MENNMKENKEIKMIYNGNEINMLGQIISSIKGNKDCETIHCYETTGHIYDIFTIRKNDIEITVYRDPMDSTLYGSEIYYYHKGTYDIKSSRNFKHFEKFPKFRINDLNEVIVKYNKIYSIIERYKNFQLTEEIL